MPSAPRLFVLSRPTVNADSYQYIVFLEQVLELLDKDAREPVVICQCRQQRNIVREADDLEPFLSLNCRCLREIAGEMRGSRCRASVAYDVDLASLLPSLKQQLDKSC